MGSFPDGGVFQRDITAGPGGGTKMGTGHDAMAPADRQGHVWPRPAPPSVAAAPRRSFSVELLVKRSNNERPTAPGGKRVAGSDPGSGSGSGLAGPGRREDGRPQRPDIKGRGRPALARSPAGSRSVSTSIQLWLLHPPTREKTSLLGRADGSGCLS